MVKTLMEMLVTNLHEDQPPESDGEEQARAWYLTAIRGTVKEWLKTVGLPDYFTKGRNNINTNATKEIRNLLIMLVDEPSDHSLEDAVEDDLRGRRE